MSRDPVENVDRENQVLAGQRPTPPPGPADGIGDSRTPIPGWVVAVAAAVAVVVIGGGIVLYLGGDEGQVAAASTTTSALAVATTVPSTDNDRARVSNNHAGAGR